MHIIYRLIAEGRSCATSQLGSVRAQAGYSVIFSTSSSVIWSFVRS
jgi:hypothetical protein